MLLEDQRFVHEDLERLEQAITERVGEDPRNIKDRLNRDHQIDGFLTRIQEQSKRLLDLYRDRDGGLAKEKQSLSTGDPFDEFYKQYEQIKDFHRRYPNEPVENLERAYKRRKPDEGEVIVSETDNMFTGEESNGRFLDLVAQHEDYLNLPSVKRLSYLQYLDNFDAFEAPRMPIKRQNKVNDRYLKYVGNLASYMEGFVRRTRPLEDLPKLFQKIDREFEQDWDAGKVPGWTKETAQNGASTTSGPQTEGTGEGVWCADCEKEFNNQNVYNGHLTGKKHKRNAEARATSGITTDTGSFKPTINGSASTSASIPTGANLKERLIASHEHRIRSLTDLLSNERSNTRVNVERKQGMTERERQSELDALFAEDNAAVYASHNRDPDASDDEDGGSDTSERVYNPLKLPLAWDGKPIPYWLYKLHGLGVEFTCEICGNFVYMGRRAFDKHFSEQRHIYGLKCLGITGSAAMGGLSLFREITGIQDALNLWEKLRRERREKEGRDDGVVQMEDGEGNVMPERIYLDLQKQGDFVDR